jgi:FkbM family methyltransferase
MKVNVIKRNLKDLVKLVIPISRSSYAQEGEDLVLSRIFEKLGLRIGFFVDVGAHHPTRYSNTYLFYKKGWRGINVDARPGVQKLFDWKRPRDINVECGVSDVPGVIKYFMFNESALNTFSPEEAAKKNVAPYFIEEIKELPVRSLTSILDEYLPVKQRVDFLTVDVEGLDYQVMNSLDFDKYRPMVIALEILNASLDVNNENMSVKAMRSKNYRIEAKTSNTYVFVDNAFGA